MSAYIIRRLLSVIPITFGVVLLTFVLFRAVGGNPVYRIAGKNASKERIEQITKSRGLDKPLFLNFEDFPTRLLDSQFPKMCWDLVRLEFGESQSTKQKVGAMLKEGFWPSLSLAVPLFIIQEILAIVLALLAAYYRDSWLDRMFVVVSVAGMSISSLVYIMVAQYWLAFEWKWFPVWGYESAGSLLLPLIIGTVAGVGGLVRFYRTVMLDEVNQDYVRTARAKGVSERGLLFRHVLRNAMIPILTSVVVEIPFLYTGSLLLESFFGIPGLGRMTVQALFNGDENVIIATVFIGSFLFVIANLITDIAYTWADPRIRLK